MSDSLWPHELYSPWNSPGQNTGVGSCSLLQGIFPVQGSNPGLRYYRQILYQLGHQGSLYILYYTKFKNIPTLKVKVLITQLCPTLRNLMDCSPPGSSVHRILQVRTLEWGSQSLLQGIFPFQGLNLGLLALWADSLPSEPPGKPNLRELRI